MLILRETGKPPPQTRERPDTVGGPRLALGLPLGAAGAMPLKRPGFDHGVVCPVAAHAGNAPFPGRGCEPFVLRSADRFAFDRATMPEGAGRRP